MNQGYYDKIVLNPRKVIYYFNGLSDFLKFTDETEKKITGNARSQWSRISGEVESQASNDEWYGTTDVDSIRGKKTSFLFNNELNTFVQALRNTTINTDIIDIDQQKKIEFTERELGIFSFDLASLGLVRVYEYYSPLLDRIVNADYVRSYELGDGQFVFYHIKIDYVVRHKIDYSIGKGGFYSQILNRVVDSSELEKVVTDTDIEYYFPEVIEIPQHDVERRQQLDEDGNLKFATTFKKCFIHIPKVTSNLPRIDIIITASYRWSIDAKTQMLWNAMAGIAIAEKLSKSNINYRIVAAYPMQTIGGTSTTKGQVYAYVKIKDENEPLNMNNMATLLSDARFFRYDIFKGAATLQWDAGYDSKIGGGLYTPINDNENDNNPSLSVTPVKDAYIEYLKQSKSYSDQQAAKVRDSKITFRQVLSQSEAENEYNRVIRKISKI
jgi:hypothetical protein